uniref:Reverse transcriptase Ty1/copia-type domain-containing protein n=1 Tax=Tanacetum cinerariifolium TaxID=118510 RepID=A0A699HEY6_TANCI|nr:hypothetical protein [Tanacetum cinerariifolium]
MNQFCEMKGILRQFSVARTPQQIGVVKKRNRTLTEGARTMIADSNDDGKKVDEDLRKESEYKDQEKEDNVNSTNNVNTAGNVNTVSSTVNVAGINEVNVVGRKISIELPFDPNMPALEDVSTFDFLSDDEDDDHPLNQVIRDFQSATQTRKMSKNLEEHRKNPKRNKKDERGIMIRNKARLIAQGYTKKKGIDYDEVFAPVTRIKAIRFIEVKITSTSMETQKPLLMDKDGKEVDVHMYRYQVNQKVSHLHAVKRISRYLKGQPKSGLWYLKDSPFDLIAYTDSDYAGASLDRKSTTEEAEYVAASSCYGQVLWIQNKLLDYGDCNEKKLIQMVKIHTDKNVADLLTKAFDFWCTAMAKTINGEAQLHAKVDGKKIIVIKSSVRSDLQLADEECLSPKTTGWNEFSSTMASAIICLPTNQWFNFLKFIFDSMIRNLDNVSS